MHQIFNLGNNTLSSCIYIVYWQFQTEDRPRKLRCFGGVWFWSLLHPQHTEGIHCQLWEDPRKVWSSQETKKRVVLEGDTFSICDTRVLCLIQFLGQVQIYSSGIRRLIEHSTWYFLSKAILEYSIISLKAILKKEIILCNLFGVLCTEYKYISSVCFL